jgi:EF-P beta-lysylation protein EpmB
VTDPRELLAMLDLDPSLLPGARRGNQLFRLRVPRGFLARMRTGDPNDPLLRQVLPLDAETVDTPGFLDDPVGDGPSLGATGVLHKYHGRVLLIGTGTCAVNCRYCFRRHFPYAEETAARGRWHEATEYIAADSSIREVILSGGDPLMLSTPKLAELTSQLEAIPHVRRLRIHSRIPVVLPERMDDALLEWLSSTSLQRVLVIHANHAAELDASVDRALAAVSATGTTLLNQAVLLRGVNDSPEALEALGERLFRAGVLPYYLHLLDRVRGAAHFQVPEARASGIYRNLRARTSGFLVPRLVREIPGTPYKTPIL